MVSHDEPVGWAFARDLVLLIGLVIALTLATGLISMDGCERTTATTASHALR